MEPEDDELLKQLEEIQVDICIADLERHERDEERRQHEARWAEYEERMKQFRG